MLKRLNDIGYGSDRQLELDLVINPEGIFFPKSNPHCARIIIKAKRTCYVEKRQRLRRTRGSLKEELHRMGVATKLSARALCV